MTLLEILEKIQNFNPSWLFNIKIFLGAFSVLLFFLIVVLSIKADRLWKLKLARESVKAVKFPKEFDKKWQTILIRMERADEANMKLAVLEADKLFELLLNQMNLPGENTDEKLSQLAPGRLSNLDDVLLAHKVRNRIIQEPAYSLTQPEAESAISAYEKAFREWEVL
jgi:hypothetical protein